MSYIFQASYKTRSKCVDVYDHLWSITVCLELCRAYVSSNIISTRMTCGESVRKGETVSACKSTRGGVRNNADGKRNERKRERERREKIYAKIPHSRIDTITRSARENVDNNPTSPKRRTMKITRESENAATIMNNVQWRFIVKSIY